MINAELKGW